MACLVWHPYVELPSLVLTSLITVRNELCFAASSQWALQQGGLLCSHSSCCGLAVEGNVRVPAAVTVLRRCSASPWPNLMWSQLCCQTWAVLAEGNEATQTLGTRVPHLFNLPEEGNYAVSPHRGDLWPVIEEGEGSQSGQGHRTGSERQGSAI